MRARVCKVVGVVAVLVVSSCGSGGRSSGNATHPCSTIAMSRVIIVAVRRDRLPTLPFTVQTKTTRCERNCDGTPLVVDSL